MGALRLAIFVLASSTTSFLLAQTNSVAPLNQPQVSLPSKPRAGIPPDFARMLHRSRGWRTNGTARAAGSHPDPASDGFIFAPALIYDSGGWNPNSIAVADLNGDGKPDLLVSNCAIPGLGCGSELGALSVQLGNGDGTFQSAVIYNTGGFAAHSVTTADVNGDGRPDALIANFDMSRVAVLLGKGDGTFEGGSQYDSGGFGASSVAVADVNGDGKPDMVVANFNCATGFTGCEDNPVGVIGVLLGNGDGTFRSAVAYGTGGYHSFSVAVTDVNEDGKPDLLVTNECVTLDCVNGISGIGGVSVLLGGGDGTFQPAVSYASGGLNAHSLTAADVNGDGKPDLLIANQFGSTSQSGGSVGVLMGIGDGTFAAVVPYDSGGFGASSVALADVNGDGKLDMLVANSCGGSCQSSDGSVGVLLGNGDGTFQSPVTYDSGGVEAGSVVAADLNGDGKPDLLVANFCGFFIEGSCEEGTIGVLINDFGLSAATTSLASSVNPSGFGQGMTFTATVVSQDSGTPTGSVIFIDGPNTLGTAALVGGHAALANSTLSAGAHSITARYSGDSTFQPNLSPALNQVVNQASTTTALSSSANPAAVTQSVTYTATVTSQFGGPVTTGLATQVVFTDGNATFFAPVVGNQASYTTSYTMTGAHFITAVYENDPNNLNSTSPALIEHIQSSPVVTKTTVATSMSPSSIGQAVTFTATVTPRSGSVPDGETVSFFDGQASIGTGLTTGGVATFTTSSLTAKSHVINAMYSGDTAFRLSTGAVNQVVSLYSSTTSVGSSFNPSTYGQAIQLTATVTSGAPASPTGIVTFKNRGRFLGSATLSSGTVTISGVKLSAGAMVITASYSGDALSADSAGTMTETVAPAITIALVTSSLNPSLSGQLVKFTATVGSPTTIVTGVVMFMDGANVLGTANLSADRASFSTSALSAGTHSITVVYAGSANINGCTSTPLVQTVN